MIFKDGAKKGNLTEERGDTVESTALHTRDKRGF